ncbi:unnamed protein product, partial [Discosporangium mesarthrocarpum]
MRGSGTCRGATQTSAEELARDGGRNRGGGRSVEISLEGIAEHALAFKRQYVNWHHGSSRSHECATANPLPGVKARSEQEEYSRANIPTPHPTTTPSGAEVVERMEEGGASFMAFRDGRVSAVFANRTIGILRPLDSPEGCHYEPPGSFSSPRPPLSSSWTTMNRWPEGGPWSTEKNTTGENNGS